MEVPENKRDRLVHKKWTRLDELDEPSLGTQLVRSSTPYRGGRGGRAAPGPTPDEPFLAFFCPGEPRPEPRPRASRTGRIYVPSDAHDWKHAVRAAAVEAVLAKWARLQAPVSDRAFGVHLEFRFARPASHFGTGRNGASVRLSAPAAKISRPDLDNLAKAVLDALGAWQGLPSLLWADDSQVVVLTVQKAYCNAQEAAGCEITLTWTNSCPT